MESVSIDNDSLAVDLPEGFYVVSLEHVQYLYGIDYVCMWGTRDDERHMVVNCIWKDSGNLITKLMSEKSLAKNAEKTLAKRYTNYQYACKGFFETTVAGTAARGFRYFYECDGVGQDCEAIVFKHGKRCYTLYYYTRPELADENRPVYEEILASLTLK